MPVTRTRRLIYTGALALGIVAGGSGLAAAATNQTAPSTAADQAGAEPDDAAPTYTASITAPDDENEANLATLATITADDATAAATAATGGTAGETELENENGNVVYGVEVTLPDGTMRDVKVDAGNATILAQAADEPDGNEADEADGVDCEDGIDAATGADCDGGPTANADNDSNEASTPEDG